MIIAAAASSFLAGWRGSLIWGITGERHGAGCKADLQRVKMMEGWWWNALSAVGTLLAVLVALWFSVQSVRSNGRADKDRSELAAAKMLSPISDLERKASYLFVWFCFTGEKEPEGQYMNTLIAIQELSVMARAISIEDLYPLLHLKRHAAKRAARALGLIQTFSSDACAVLTHHTWSNVSAREIHHERWRTVLSEIKDHLAVAVIACETAASMGAPRPTPDEIYDQ